MSRTTQTPAGNWKAAANHAAAQQTELARGEAGELAERHRREAAPLNDEGTLPRID